MNTDKGQLKTEELFDLATTEGRVGALTKAATFVCADLPLERGLGHYPASERLSGILQDIREEVRLARELGL